MLAHAVGPRTWEIGIRTALGAQAGDVARLVVRQSLTLVAIGVVVGLGLAFVEGRILRSQLFGVSSLDAVSLLLAPAVLVGVALVAACLPARRALAGRARRSAEGGRVLALRCVCRDAARPGRLPVRPVVEALLAVEPLRPWRGPGAQGTLRHGNPVTFARTACSMKPTPTACSPGRARAGSASTPPYASRATTEPASNGCSAGYPPKVGGARPPFALERLHAPAGTRSLASAEARLVYRLPRPAQDGRTELRLSPLELLERLARFIPPPRVHRHRYHGVLAPNAKLRAAVVAIGRPEVGVSDLSLASPTPILLPPREDGPAWPANPARIRWAMLLARIYGVLPLLCPACGGPMRILAFLTDPPIVSAILVHLELCHEPPPISPARGPRAPREAWSGGFSTKVQRSIPRR